MLRKLRPYQKDALSYTKDKDQIALLMEMRLGKSCVAIRWAKRFPGRKLIVAPLSVLASWEEELEKEEQTKVFYLKKAKQLFMDSWFLINYEGLRARPHYLDWGWETIICDESTKIRNPQAKITKLLCDDLRIPRRAILSGLPAPESSLDYFQQMKFLHGSFLGFDSYWSFRQTLYYNPPYTYDWIPRKNVVNRIKEAVHESAFVLTRKQAKIGPEKIYEKRYVEKNALQKRLYKEVMKTFEYKNNDVEMATKWATVKFVWLARIAGGFGADGIDFLSGAKAEELLSLLKGELREEKVVVWFRFNKELEYVSKVLDGAGIQYSTITGSRKPAERKDATENFRKDSRVMLAQVKCGAFGLNWSCASTAIYYSNGYDAEYRAQSEDRILDVAKKEPLLYIDLVTKGTIDESISRVLRQKYSNSRMFMTALVKDWLKNMEKKNA